MLSPALRNRLYLLTAIPFLACLLAGASSFAPAPGPCDVDVKDGLNGLLWHCSTSTCSNCGNIGSCESSVVGSPIESHTCSCSGITAACYSTIQFNTTTGIVKIKCADTCCSVDCLQPGVPLPAYPNYTDPCPCTGDEIAH
jgi:hypothetical protein